jgi:hypothetical protein
MWKAALAGAVALATVGSLSVSIEGVGIDQAAAQDIIVTESHIARLKSVLKLTPSQERHWHAVEATLRAIMRSQGQGEGGLVQRTRARIAGFVLSSAAMQRLSSVAQPLIASLDDSQKQDGLMVIRSMGIASLM